MGEATQVSRLLAVMLPGACALFLTAVPHDASASEAWRAHVATGLQSAYDASLRASPTPSANGTRFDSQGRVEADVHYDCSSSAPTAALSAAGLVVTSRAHLPPLCVVEGWIAPDALPALATVSGVARIKIPSYAWHIPRPTLKSTAASQTSGSIDGNALTIMHANQFVAQAGGGGNGVTVGVQSTGAYSLSTVQARNELPSVNVLTAAAGASPEVADEGTVLLEEIHAVAPNAALAFCEPQTFVEYTNCLQQFVKAGATVMADDILFFDQNLLSSDGTDTAALEQFLTQNPNVALFTAGGNDNGSYWEGTYTPVTTGSAGTSDITCPGSSQVDHYVNQFAAAANEIMTITPTTPISVPVTFAWSDPPGQNGSKFDVYWTNSTDATKSGCVSTAASTDTVITQTITLYPGPNTLYIATPDASAAGKFLKLWVGGDGLTALSIATPGSFVSPQTFAAGAISVGAVNGSDGVGNSIETFSSRGPISVLFPSAAKIQAPIFVAPDGIYVDAAGTYFSSELFPDGNFYGTSAAVPNAAAVGALLRGAFPNLTVPQLLSALESGATQLGASTPDSTFGYGRIDAMGALGTLPAPTMTSLSDVSIDASSSTTSAPVPFTISGTGTIHFSVTSTNSTLIPASVAATGAAGITVSSGCGSTTLTCSLTVTAAQYQGGTATVTVSAVDGAGRSAPATMHVTVNNPQMAPPPAPPATATGSGGHGGGGSLSLWEVFAALAALLARPQFWSSSALARHGLKGNIRR